MELFDALPLLCALAVLLCGICVIRGNASPCAARKPGFPARRLTSGPALPAVLPSVPAAAVSAEIRPGLDERLMSDPAAALNLCKRQAAAMAAHTRDALAQAVSLVERWDREKAEFVQRNERALDECADILEAYLVRLSGKALSTAEDAELDLLLHTVGDIERISDYAMSIQMSCENLYPDGCSFSADAVRDLSLLSSCVLEGLDRAIEAFSGPELRAAHQAEQLERESNHLYSELRERHIARLRDGRCAQRQGAVFADLISDLRQIGRHCAHIAVCSAEACQRGLSGRCCLYEVRPRNAAYRRSCKDHARNCRPGL